MFDYNGKNILAIAPHIDDVELGAGATIYGLGKNNNVIYVGLSIPPLVELGGFMQEFKESAKCLGLKPENIILKNYDPRNLFNSRGEILQLLYDLNKKYKPELVFIPNSYDMHQSHEVVHAEGRRAFKHTTILGYELPWNYTEFSMDVFVTLDKEALQAKVDAVNAYETQKSRTFFSNNIVEDLARVRGKQIEKEYAECFELIRWIA